MATSAGLSEKSCLVMFTSLILKPETIMAAGLGTSIQNEQKLLPLGVHAWIVVVCGQLLYCIRNGCPWTNIDPMLLFQIKSILEYRN